jgi:chromate transport protein ChrA
MSREPHAATGATNAAELRHPTFAEAFRFWLKLGFISFGGPAGQIAIMQTELVEKRRWISQSRFLHALNFCMLLPGPEAQQLAIYIGWLLHRTWGGIVAGALFVIPSMFILWGLSFVYVAYGNVPWIAAVFYGLKPAVMAIVAAAVIRIGRKALKNEVMWTIAAFAFIAIFFLKVPFPIIVLGAGILGLLGARLWPAKFAIPSGHAAPAEHAAVLGDDDTNSEHTTASFGRAIRIAAVGFALWWLPILLVGAWHGWDGTLFREGLFFSKAGSGDIRRRVRRAAVRRATGRRAIRLAPGRPDDGWPGAGRDDTWAADHGAAIRRVHGRVESTWRVAAAHRRDARRAGYHLGDVRAVLSLDLPWRALCGAAARETSRSRRHSRRSRRPWLVSS